MLDVGTGSGATAVLAELAAEVESIERVPELAESARRALERRLRPSARHVGDGTLGLPELAPFGGTAVAAAMGEVPRELWDQLEDGGRIVLPLGRRRASGSPCSNAGEEAPRRSVPARFVPLVEGGGGPARARRATSLAFLDERKLTWYRRGPRLPDRRPGPVLSVLATAQYGALRRPHWIQPAKFGVVGLRLQSSIYRLRVPPKQVDPPSGAASVSFLAAATNNYIWNRLWTFRHQRGNVAYRGCGSYRRGLAYGANLC